MHLFLENFISPDKCTWENKKFLCANNHTCIDIQQVCDGKHQCPDKSDESVLCSSPNHQCSRHNCSHTCVQLPTGPQCYCPEGYHYINEKECQDINECETYGKCAISKYPVHIWDSKIIWQEWKYFVSLDEKCNYLHLYFHIDISFSANFHFHRKISKFQPLIDEFGSQH